MHLVGYFHKIYSVNAMECLEECQRAIIKRLEKMRYNSFARESAVPVLILV